MLKVKNLSYKYNKKNDFIIKDINFELCQNEILGIYGNSGCGKTTIANCLLGFLNPQKGTIDFNNTPIQILRKKKKLHTIIQMVMQNPETSFNPTKTIRYSLNEVKKFLGNELKEKEFNNDFNSNLEILELHKDLLSKYPEELSGGQLQRFSILRALLLNPKIIIFDEATTMLDTSVQSKIIKLLLNIKKEKNLSYIFISHNLDLLNLISNKILIINNGICKYIDRRDYVF